jgi:sulfur carrier protein
MRLTVRVVVNGEPVRMRGATLHELVIALGHGEAKIATAVNGTFVPEGRRAGHNLTEDDRVEIVSPRQGG